MEQVLENSSSYLSWPRQEGAPFSPDLINRSYYLCSSTDDWLLGTGSANHKVLVFKPEQWECYLEGRGGKNKPWILLIDKSLCFPKGLLVPLSSWQVETQRSQDAEALPKSTPPRHILSPEPVLREVTQTRASTLMRPVSSPVVTKESVRRQVASPVPFS